MSPSATASTVVATAAIVELPTCGPEDGARQHVGVVLPVPRVGRPDGSTVISEFERKPPRMMYAIGASMSPISTSATK